MIEFLKKKWVEWLCSFTIAVIAVVLTNSLMIKREYKSAIVKSLEQKANKDYVDSQDLNIMKYIDKQDENTTNYIKQHAVESEQANQKTMELIKSMDSKLNILLNRQR